MVDSSFLDWFAGLADGEGTFRQGLVNSRYITHDSPNFTGDQWNRLKGSTSHIHPSAQEKLKAQMTFSKERGHVEAQKLPKMPW